MARAGNVHKGGRPKGSKSNHTLEAAAAKAKIIEMVNANIVAIIQPMITKAITGDVPAARELMDRAYGKATQAVVTLDSDGNNVSLQSINVIPVDYRPNS